MRYPPGFTGRILDSEDDNPVRGDTVRVLRTFEGAPMGDPAETARLTMKRQPRTSAAVALMLEITTSASDNGQITDDGSGDGNVELEFLILPADYANILPSTPYFYDIQLTTVDGVISTQERGVVIWDQDISETA